MNTINSQNLYNIENICRTCLGSRDVIPLFSDCKEDICIIEMLMCCTLVQFSENDGLPKKICKTCIGEIKRCYKFAKQCEKSDELVRGYIKILKTEKLCIEAKTKRDTNFGKAIKKEKQIEVIEIKDEEEHENAEYLWDENITETDNYMWKAETVDNNIIVSYNPEPSNKDGQVKKSTTKKPISWSSGQQYHCKKCNQTFDQFSLLKEHRSTHSKNDYSKRQCTICSKLISYSHYKHHLRTHTSEKPYCCEYCGKRFVIRSNLIRHQRTHNGERPFQCEICQKAFTQSTRLKDHMRMHSGEKPFVCNVCGKCFAQSDTFKTHLKRHEKEDCRENESKRKSKQDSTKENVSSQCDVCFQIFFSVGALKTHMVTHAEKNYSCSICGRGFVSMLRLKKHLKSHDEVKPFQCLVCEKSFTMKTSLKNHTLIHTGEKKYPCDICGKSFTQVGQLTYHKRTHTGVKPFSCQYCGKKFALNGNLTVHIRQHTGETPYYCPVCHKGYYDSSSMKKHLRTHSNDLTK